MDITVKIRCCVIMIGVMLLHLTNLYAQLTEGFSDGDFISNPEWVGNTDRFIVNQYKQLQSRVDYKADSYLTVELGDDKCMVWEFYVRIGCATTAYNFARVYLQADNVDPSMAEGYYVQVGGANKDISLRWQSSDGSNRVVISNAERKKILDTDNSKVHIRVIRDEYDYLSLYTMVEGKDVDYELEGSKFVGDMMGSYFSLFVRNSAQTGRLYYFDDIIVKGDTVQADMPLPMDFDISLRARHFSPREYGDEQYCYIDYSLPSHGFTLKAEVFTPNGVKIADIKKGEKVEEEGVIEWSGETNAGSLVDVGVYVIMVEVWNRDTGLSYHKRLTVAVR